MSDRRFYLFVNSSFARLSKDKTNARLISDLVKKVYLRKSIVACLARIEAEDTVVNWWQDKELLSVFKNMHQAGVLPLPSDPVERVRWVALICVRACELDKFKYGNLITPLDYLPDDLIDDSYGVSTLIDIQNLREDLKNRGWNTVFGW